MQRLQKSAYMGMSVDVCLQTERDSFTKMLEDTPKRLQLPWIQGVRF